MIDNRSTYNLVVQEYLCMAIKKIMELLQENKLHNFCFYITFEKNYADNIFPNKDNEDFITIVLQHQFWDLEVDKDGFEVTLEMCGQKERIYVCFESILLFTDQISNFILDFRAIHDQEDQEIEKDQEIIFVELP